MTLGALFAPRGVAVVGASRQPGKLGAVMARSLGGFASPIVLVNARDPDPAAGLHASVRDAVAAAGAPVDLAVLCVPAKACVEAVTEAGAAGVRAALVCAGGFAEVGDAGAGVQRALVEAAAAAGVWLLGPNTSGFLVPARRLTATFVPGAAAVPAGRVAVVAASGGVNHALAFLLAEAGHGVSVAVGLGNSADVTAADVLDFLATDCATTAVALHVEAVPDGARLLDAVTALTATRPVVALVVGRHDVAEFAQSHTGALATSWRTTRAALRQAGAVLVDDERELVEAVAALSLTRLPPLADPGVGVVTAQAGPGLLLLDGLRGGGVRVPELAKATQDRLSALLPPMTFQRNPVDTGRPGPGFPPVLATVAADPGVDVLAVYALTEPDTVDLAAAAEQAGLPTGPPTVVGLGGPAAEVSAVRAALHHLGVPTTVSPSALAGAVRSLVDDARAQARAAARADDPPGTLPTPLDPGGPWDEDRAKALLDALGVATPPRRACATREQAMAALEALPGPLAVKLLDAAVLHKTEVGGVHLGVRTREQLVAALDALDAVGARRYLVESMAPPGVDLVVGARRDPVFGPVVLVGLGGTAAEALADVALRVAPVPAAEAEEMPDDLAARALLDGWRGGPVLDRRALGRVVRALGALLLAAPELADVEINPLRVTADGLVALDAVVTVREESPDGPSDR